MWSLFWNIRRMIRLVLIGMVAVGVVRQIDFVEDLESNARQMIRTASTWAGSIGIPAASAAATNARVIDGDTIEWNGKRVRLEGIDAPESRQQCQDRTGEPWACGTEATRALKDLVDNDTIECKGSGTDRYRAPHPAFAGPRGHASRSTVGWCETAGRSPTAGTRTGISRSRHRPGAREPTCGRAASRCPGSGASRTRKFLPNDDNTARPRPGPRPKPPRTDTMCPSSTRPDIAPAIDLDPIPDPFDAHARVLEGTPGLIDAPAGVLEERVLQVDANVVRAL